MVKRRKKGITKKATGKGFNEAPQEAREIGAPTIYVSEQGRVNGCTLF